MLSLLFDEDVVTGHGFGRLMRGYHFALEPSQSQPQPVADAVVVDSASESSSESTSGSAAGAPVEGGAGSEAIAGAGAGASSTAGTDASKEAAAVTASGSDLTPQNQMQQQQQFSKAVHRFFNATEHLATSLQVVLNDIDETVQIVDRGIILADVQAWRAIYSPQRCCNRYLCS